MQSLRPLLIHMSSDESIAAARPLARALRAVGCELVCASYFGTGADASPFGDDVAYLSIAAYDLARQTAWARAGAQNAARYHLPLARCLGHTLLASGLPALAAGGDPYWIPWFAASWRLEQLMRAVQPSHVLVQQGSEGIAKLAVLHASQLGIPTLLWDTPFFPEHLLVDHRGMHFFSPASDIDAEWQRLRDRPLKDSERARLRAFVETYRREERSKYSQPEDRHDVALLEEAGQSGRLVFYPGQVPHDANVYAGLDGFRSLDEFEATLAAAVPAPWRLTAKHHPKDPRSSGKGRWPASVLGLSMVSIRRLIEAAEVVVVHSSNVGLEALLLGKPVITLGAPHYSRRGFTVDLENLQQLGPALEGMRDFKPDLTLLERYLHLVVFTYLVAENTPELLLHKLQAASPSQSPTTAPYCHRYPRVLEAYLEQIGEAALPEDLGAGANANTVRFTAAQLATPHAEFRRNDTILITPSLRERLDYLQPLISYGPYAVLGVGSYRVEVDIDVLGSRGIGPKLWMDCAAQCGRQILGRWPAPPRLEGLSVLVGRFDLDAPGRDVEARVYGTPGVSVLITAVRFIRLDAAASR